MLHSTSRGYAVMNKELNAYSIEDIDLEMLKRYCKNGDVIAERIPKAIGFKMSVYWCKWHKPIEFRLKYGEMNIFWLHLYFSKNYTHRTGKIVYRSDEKK